MTEPSSIRATFDIEMSPGNPILAGTHQFDFTKTWRGDIAGTGRGVMTSAGDPAAGTAGYVAFETFEGTVDGRTGAFALQQFGTMHGGSEVLHYEVVPGSGSGALTGIAGTVALDVVDGEHRVRLHYTLD